MTDQRPGRVYAEARTDRRYRVTMSCPRPPGLTIRREDGSTHVYDRDRQQWFIDRCVKDPGMGIFLPPYPELEMTARTARVVYEVTAADAGAAVTRTEEVLRFFLSFSKCTLARGTAPDPISGRRNVEQVIGPLRVSVVELDGGTVTASTS